MEILKKTICIMTALFLLATIVFGYCGCFLRGHDSDASWGACIISLVFFGVFCLLVNSITNIAMSIEQNRSIRRNDGRESNYDYDGSL